jgi:hypothetical protein
MKQPKDIMRGRAWDFDGAPIEFGSEPEQFFRTILYEHLPPAKQCGAATVKGLHVCAANSQKA